MTKDNGSPKVQHALVRPLGATFVEALSSGGEAIDVTLAQAQHTKYCRALTAAGLLVEMLPVDERFPDSCFLQDPAVVVGGQAVVGRMGAASRRGEEEAVAEWLASRFPLRRLAAPATLEGGDVLILPDRLTVGLSGRTNQQGIEQLSVALREGGETRPVHAVPVSDYLHLLTALTYIGQDTLLVVEGFTLPPELHHLKALTVPAEEAYAVNVLAVGSKVILPAGYPRVAARLRAAGFDLLPVPMTEFAKADGGVTCLSLTW